MILIPRFELKEKNTSGKVMTKEFDLNKADSQATIIEPVTPDAFDFEAYAAYEADLLPCYSPKKQGDIDSIHHVEKK